MELRTGVILRGSALLSMVFASAYPCYAQAGTAARLSTRPAEGDSVKKTAVIVGPAFFLGIDSRTGTTRTTTVPFISADHAVVISDKQGEERALQVGAFYYVNGRDRLTNVNTKLYANRHWGAQLGYQYGSDGGNATQVFALYNLSSSTADPAAKIHWDLQVGAGALLNVSNATQLQARKNPFSGFVQLSVSRANNLSFNLSYWGIASARKSSINRLFLGVGTSF
jgi:hypothetical protein